MAEHLALEQQQVRAQPGAPQGSKTRGCGSEVSVLTGELEVYEDGERCRTPSEGACSGGCVINTTFGV